MQIAEVVTIYILKDDNGDNLSLKDLQKDEKMVHTSVVAACSLYPIPTIHQHTLSAHQRAFIYQEGQRMYFESCNPGKNREYEKFTKMPFCTSKKYFAIRK